MATPFEFPLSYIESMLPTAATAHETVTAPMPQDTTTIDSAAALKELLSSLESPTVPQPQQPRQYQRVLGALGDALGSMASVRAGGAPVPVGPFAANQRAQQAAYEKQRQEAATGMADTRNKVRIGAFEEGLRAKREKEVALARNQARLRAFQLKQFQTTDAQGHPITVPYNYNPNTGVLAPIAGQEQGFERYVRPFLAQGINQDTGEMEFRLLDPFSGAGGGGRTEAGPTGAPPQGGGQGNSGGGVKVPGFEPKPSTGEIEGAESATVIKEQLSQFKQLASTYKGGERMLGTARATGQGVVRSVPLVGKALSESFGDPDYEELSATRNRIGQQLARLVENGRLSDQDRDFALENLPTIESLTTESGRKTAAAKIALVEKEIEIRMSRKRRLRPGLMGGGVGPYNGTVLHEADFADAAPGERDRFIAGGGRVEP